jgi:hypothetical protein
MKDAAGEGREQSLPALQPERGGKSMVTESGQLDLVDALSDQLRPVEDGIANIESTLNPQIDANPNDKLLMEMLDVVTDARESIQELRDLLQTMRDRDLSENPIG